jgi:hypothetical protein
MSVYRTVVLFSISISGDNYNGFNVPQNSLPGYASFLFLHVEECNGSIASRWTW